MTGTGRRWSRGRSRAAVPSESMVAAGEAFGAALDAVEGAKASLVTAVRSGRAPGAPLAEALARFETGLADARDRMQAWRVPDVTPEWSACRGGLDRAMGRAERLRLSAEPPQIYEELVLVLAELMDPLDPFEDASARFRDLGVRLR